MTDRWLKTRPLPARQTDRMLLTAEGLRGNHRNSPASRLRGNIATRYKAQKGAAPWLLSPQPSWVQKGEGFSKVLLRFQGAPCSPAERVLWQRAAPRLNQGRDESSRTRCPVNDAQLLCWCFVSLSPLHSSDGPGSLTQTDFYTGCFLAFWLISGGRYMDN